jgi:hypothetical protein
MTPNDAVSPRTPRRVTHVVARRLRDAGVLVNLKTNDIFELNDTAMRVWELLDDPNAVSDIVMHLVREFDVDPDVAWQQTAAVLERFEQQGVVTA